MLYVAVAARFARATLEGGTKYKRVSRWRLALLWPLLAAFSPEFREELKGALAPLQRERKDEREEEKNASETKEEAGGSIGGGNGALFSFSPPKKGQEKKSTAATATSSFDER